MSARVASGPSHSGLDPDQLRRWWQYPDRRPNRGSSAGGYGWWLVGQLADAVDVAGGPDGDGTAVTVTVRG